MENFDDLLKKKIEGKTHDFQFSHWKSFCSKAGIKAGFSALQIATVTSISVAVATSIVVSSLYFTDYIQPVSLPIQEDFLQTACEDFLQTAYIDTCDTEPITTLLDSIDIPKNEELAIVSVPVKKENTIKKEPVKNEPEILPVQEPKTETPPKREYIRRIDMRIDTIKSDNQLY